MFYMDKNELKNIVLDQNNLSLEGNFIEREIFAKAEEYMKNDFVIVLTGLRRTGKSTLLKQLRRKYPGYYLNFDDDRLVNFSVQDFQDLYEILIELFGVKNLFYFDEIQNVLGWERFVRRLHDENKKVFVTGSNANTLSQELGTHLTGRHLNLTLFPFSFREYLLLKNFLLGKNDFYLTEKRALIKKYLFEYIKEGGLPEYLISRNKEYIKTLYENILYKDIITRYKLGNEKSLKEILYFVVNNFSKEISFNSLKKLTGLGSSTTVKDYFEFMENCYLIFLVQKFDYSFKKRVYANKKVYLIDNAFANYLSSKNTEGYGELLENTVFLELLRMKKEIFYFRGKKECDFVVREGIKITQAIQVCYDFNKETKEREISGLSEAMTQFKLKEGLILTYDQEDEIKIKGKKVKKIIIKPGWKWLLGQGR